MNRAREPHLRMPPAPEATAPAVPPIPQHPAPQQPAYPPQYVAQPPYDPAQWNGYPPPPQQQPYSYYGQQPQQQMPYQYPVTTQHVAAQPLIQQQPIQPPPPPVYDSTLDDPEPYAPKPSPWRVMFAIIGLIAIAGLSWIAYYWGPSHDGPPPLIPAPEGPYKVKPESPGGAAIAYKDTLVYDRLAQHPHQTSGEQNVVILPDEPSMPAVPEAEAQPPQQSPIQGTPLSHMNQTPVTPQAPTVEAAQPPQQAPAVAPIKPESTPKQEMDSMLAKLSDIQEIPTTGQQVYFLQMATLKSDAEAIMEMKRLKSKLHLQQSKWHVRKNENAAGDTQYVLLLGPYKTRDEAKKRCGTIKNGCSVVAAQ